MPSNAPRGRLASHGITGDVARKEDVYPIAIQALGLLGGVDVLVNNASSPSGRCPSFHSPIPRARTWNSRSPRTCFGPFRLTKALLGALASAARDGRRPLVLNISSDAAVTPYANWGAYGASKAALQHLSRIWDQELEPEGVRVLSIDPGDMDTPLHALAVPDASRDGLKPPQAAAREIAELIEAHVAPHASERTDTNPSIVGPFVEVR